MMKFNIADTDFLKEQYLNKQNEIRERLQDFKKVPESEYFYELCFCILTPQSRARNAEIVVNILKANGFFNKPFFASEILGNKEHYIRFHNNKSKYLLEAVEKYPNLLKILKTDISSKEKREFLHSNFNGIGLKESSHFLRNIGLTGLAILDRHILRNLVKFGALDELPDISTKPKYLKNEDVFAEFAEMLAIPMDELDLLFWSFGTGEILK